MSSDVSIYFCPNMIPLTEISKSRYHYCNKCDRIGLGDLGLMCYFGYDLLTALCNISYNKVCSEWAQKAIEAINEFERAIVFDKQLTSEAFREKYGYCGPKGIDWQAYPSIDTIRRIQAEFSGQYLYISWD